MITNTHKIQTTNILKVKKVQYYSIICVYFLWALRLCFKFKNFVLHVYVCMFYDVSGVINE